MKLLHKILILLFCSLLLFQCKTTLPTESVPNIVTFSDVNFEELIRETLNKPSGIITKSDMSSITRLDGWAQNINNIDGIQYCKNLEWLTLSANKISDINALTDLTNLHLLIISDNQIIDISALSSLTNLKDLYLTDNQIIDIGALSGLTNLEWLTLSANKISDIQPLIQNQGINDGDRVDLFSNPLSEISIGTYIPQLLARGVKVGY